MLQAEVGGGGRVDPEGGLQRPGYLIRDFVLTSARGKRVQISDYRGRSNLVLIFAGQAAAELDFLEEAAKQDQDLAQQEAVVITIFQYMPQQAHLLRTWAKLPFLVLVDGDGRVNKLYGAVDEHGRPAPVIYVTDRFGEIVSVYHTRSNENLPNAENVLKLLEFINHQCPECEPPEWPR